MKIYILAENTALEGFSPEHGLSLYIETGERKLLFDTGASGRMADHAQKLGVELAAVDALILSHGHYDHGGGLSRFLECNAAAPVYLSRYAFGAHYNGQGAYIGLDRTLRDSRRLVWLEEPLELFPGVTIHPGYESVYPVDAAGLQAAYQGTLQPERFLHEQYLLIREGERKICFSGCAHRGVLNIVHWFQPDVLVGGFHFKHLPADHPSIQAAARQLLEADCTYYTGHCTGQQQYETMKAIMGSRLNSIHTGCVISL